MMSKFWKNREKSSDLYISIKPMLFISFFVGLTPFSISGPVGNRKLQVTFLGFVSTIFHIIVYVICFILSFINGATLAGYFFNSEISIIGDTLQRFTGLFGMTMIFITCLLERNTFIKIIESIAQIDNRLSDLSVILNYGKSYRIAVIAAFVMFTVNSGYIIGSIKILCNINISPSFTAYIAFFVPQVIVSTVVVIFVCIAHKITSRYAIINEILNDLSEKFIGKYATPQIQSRPNSCESFSIYGVGSKNQNDIVDDAMQIHCLLCNAAATANKYFAYQLLTIFAISFLIIVFDAYYVLESILGQTRREIHFNTTEFVVFFSCQMLLYILAVFAIVEAGSKAVNQSEKTAEFVHKLLNGTKDPDLKQKLSYFSMQLIHEKVRFTAAGLFNIDRTLYFTMFGAASTYLIILLQFSSTTEHQISQQNVTRSSFGVPVV